jgi:hypothetical protein
VKTIALSLGFLLEVCILASFCAWAASLPLPVHARVALGGFACVGAATYCNLHASFWVAP